MVRNEGNDSVGVSERQFRNKERARRGCPFITLGLGDEEAAEVSESGALKTIN